MFIEEDAPVSGHPLARNWCVSGVVNEKTGVFVVGGNNPRCGEISREVKKVCFFPPIKRKNKQKLKRGISPSVFCCQKKHRVGIPFALKHRSAEGIIQQRVCKGIKKKNKKKRNRISDIEK